MSPIVWVSGLLVLGLAVMILEVFIPSGGILGFVSIAAIVAAVSTAFLEMGMLPGLATLAVAAVGVPAALALAFHLFPSTPLGRRVLPPPPDAAELLPDKALRARVRTLVGRSGRATSDLLPWGSVEIDGEVFDAVSEAGPIDRESAIVAVAAQGAAVVVALATAEPGGRLRRFVAEAEPAPGGDAHSPVLEQFEFERFDTTGR